MELPQTTEWALHCCWLLAHSDGTPVARRRLAEFFVLPEPYLAKMLKSLVNGGVLGSVPGVFGGYHLARPAADISVLDVVQSISGRQDMFRCAEIRQRGPMARTAAQCRRPCGIAAVMHQADTAWRATLAAITIADLIADTAKASADRIAVWLGQ